MGVFLWTRDTVLPSITYLTKVSYEIKEHKLNNLHAYV